MIKCLTCGKIFDEYEYKDVVWSSDKLPCCPACKTTPYEGEFKPIEDKS